MKTTECLIQVLEKLENNLNVERTYTFTDHGLNRMPQRPKLNPVLQLKHLAATSVRKHVGIECLKYFTAGYVILDGLKCGCCGDLNTRSASPN